METMGTSPRRCPQKWSQVSSTTRSCTDEIDGRRCGSNSRDHQNNFEEIAGWAKRATRSSKQERPIGAGTRTKEDPCEGQSSRGRGAKEQETWRARWAKRPTHKCRATKRSQ